MDNPFREFCFKREEKRGRSWEGKWVEGKFYFSKMVDRACLSADGIDRQGGGNGHEGRGKAPAKEQSPREGEGVSFSAHGEVLAFTEA